MGHSAADRNIVPLSCEGQPLARTTLTAVFAVSLAIGGIGAGSAPATATPSHPVKQVVIDPAPTEPAAPRALSRALVDLDQTFALHSNPGSTRTIFLDFDGANVSGTAWNNDPHLDVDLPAGDHPGWDPDGDGPAFNDDERAMVQEVWARVAEDYAPFDVDVTTQQPAAHALQRTGEDDLVYGVRVLITPSDAAMDGICGGGCGGVALLDVFAATDVPDTAYYHPAWVFPQALGDDPASIADAASHEVGHTLGLEHDGRYGDDYYGGHGVWGPIMGAPYDRPVSQWSNGAYAGATRTENDVAIIGAQLELRDDEAGATVGTSAPLSSLTDGDGWITGRDDVDVLALGSCEGEVTVTARPADTGPNLDIRLRLLDQGGAALASADPAVAAVSASVARGLDATITRSLTAGSYYAEVDGVGFGTVNNGYDDYGSLGAYTLTAVGCEAPTPSRAPSAPTALAATPDPDEPAIHLTWAAPDDLGSPPLGGYRVSRSDAGGIVSQDLPAGATSYTFAGLSPDTQYTVSVVALNSAGAGPEASRTVTTSPAEVTAPGAVRDLGATWDAGTSRGTVTWRAPLSDGGSAIDHYAVTVDGEPIADQPADPPADPVTLSIMNLTPGAHEIAVRAVNGDGRQGPARTATLSVPAAAPGPVGDLAAAWNPASRAVDVSWTAPLDDGGVSIKRYEVTLTGMTAVRTATPTATSVSIGSLPADSYEVSVRAVNTADLTGPSATYSQRITVPTTGGGGGGVSAPGVVGGLRAAWNAGTQRADVSWSAPSSDGGAAIDHFLVAVDGQRLPALPAGTTLVSVALSPGSHAITVRAVNAVGYEGAPSTVTLAVPAAGPSAACIAATQAATAATTKAAQTKAKAKKAKRARNAAKAKRLKAKLRKAQQRARQAGAEQASACG